jgi:hypothetical protein
VKNETSSLLLRSLRYRFGLSKEIDHLISGLQGIRQKLDDDGDRIQREIGQYASFSQSIVDLTKIVSDGMTAIKTMAHEVIELPKASPADLNKR